MSWYVSVIRPICAKLSGNSPFRIGYIARISDCIMSLIMCEALIAPNTRYATRGGAEGKGRAAGEVDMSEGDRIKTEPILETVALPIKSRTNR